MIAAYIVFALGKEGGAPLAIDQPGRGIGEIAIGITHCLAPLGVEEQCPSGAEPLKDVIGARASRHEFGLGCRFEIGAAERQCALEAAILVEDDAGRDQCRPG